MTEILAGSSGVITGAEWLGVVVVAVVFAIVGGIVVWFVGGARYDHTRREGRGGDEGER